MKKILALSSAILLLAASEASAQVSISATIGNPGYVAEEPYYPTPGYVMAPDWPSNHYDHHRHPHNDYWARHDEAARGHVAHPEMAHHR